MRLRQAKKIVQGTLGYDGRKRWSPQSVYKADRLWAAHRLRGFPMSSPKTRSGWAVQGAKYATIDGHPLYLFAVEEGEWMLPMAKTDRQEKEALRLIAKFGKVPNGWKLVNDGDSFVRSFPREHEGKPIAFAVNFASRDMHVSHMTVSLH